MGVLTTQVRPYARLNIRQDFQVLACQAIVDRRSGPGLGRRLAPPARAPTRAPVAGAVREPLCCGTDPVSGMRYLVQFLIPALIFIGVVYLLTRPRRQDGERGAAPTEGSDTGAFIAILALGAIVALGTALVMSSFWE